MRIRREREARETAGSRELHVDAAAGEAGLRVLRELGDGGTACVCLVVPLDVDPFIPFDAVRAALKIPRFESTATGRVREDRVLASVRSPHVVALLGTPGGRTRCLLLEHLAGGTLAGLLARREFLRVGEAVTILVSLVRALSALHAAGYWHGSLSASKVMFAADGRPVIVGLSHAVPVAGESRSSGSAEAPDNDGFREIVALVARAVGDEAIVPGAGELAVLARASLSPSMNASAWQRLESQVFAVGRPEPVLLAPPDAAPVHGLGRASEAVGTEMRSHVTSRTSLRRGPSLTEWFRSERLAGILRVMRTKRKLVVYSAACLLAAAIVTIAMVSTDAAPSKDDAGRLASAADNSVTGPSKGESDPSSSGAATERQAQAEGGTATPTDNPAQQDDPVDAASRLLSARYACFSSKPIDPHCLDAMVQPGSAIDAIDRTDLRTGMQKAAAEGRDFRSYEVSLIERMGDAALLALTPPMASADTDAGHAQTKPASLLIVRGEAGWRLRELFEN